MDSIKVDGSMPSAPPFIVVYRDGDWAITAGAEFGIREAWIVHLCELSPGSKERSRTWSYVRSTEYALRINHPHMQYVCIQCDKRASDSMITIHTLYK